MANISDFTTDRILYWQGVVVHEMTHLLGFMGPTWKMLKDKRGVELVTFKDGRFWVTVPSIVETAKQYWNCSNVFGLPLENNGNSGTFESHWEKTSFSPELMTGSAEINFYYSQFTALML